MESDIYTRFEQRESACLAAEEDLKSAKTGVGRMIASLRLAHHRRVLGDVIVEAETHEFLAIRENQMLRGVTPVERSK